MIKNEMLNPQMSTLLTETGHKDYVVVSDAGLPMPLGVKRIDLAWKPGEPKYLDVLELVLKQMVVEKVILAEELKTVSPEMHKEILELLPIDMVIEYMPHVDFKEETTRARGIIRTGEFTPYPSIILVAGCAY